MYSPHLGFLFGMSCNGRHFIFHFLDVTGQIVVLIEQPAKMCITQFQLVNTVFQFRELMNKVVVLYLHKLSFIWLANCGCQLIPLANSYHDPGQYTQPCGWNLRLDPEHASSEDRLPAITQSH